jgi:hypothetical protein
MAVYEFGSQYALIVGTNEYTGNFEREFCAYVTGSYGECGVGEELAEEFLEEEGAEAESLTCLTCNEMDDRGCARPVSIYDDGDRYNSLIIFLEDHPNEKEWEIIIRRAKQFCIDRPDWCSWRGEKKPLELKGIRLISNQVVRTQEVLKVVEL